MTAAELIARLSEVDPNTEVRLMTQENYPFEHSVKGAWFCDTASIENGDPEEESFFPASDKGVGHAEVFYIVEGRQIGYGTRLAFGEAY